MDNLYKKNNIMDYDSERQYHDTIIDFPKDVEINREEISLIKNFFKSRFSDNQVRFFDFLGASQRTKSIKTLFLNISGNSRGNGYRIDYVPLGNPSTISIYITKTEDEWFHVFSSDTHLYWYRCDQIDGLLECLSDIVKVSKKQHIYRYVKKIFK